MALIAHQTQGSYASFRSSSISWTKNVKLKPILALRVIRRLDIVHSFDSRFCLSMKASPILRPRVKCLKVSAFKGNAQNDESGSRSTGSKTPKNSVNLSYLPHEDEEIKTESPDTQEAAPLTYNSGEETTASPAIQKLFRKWLMMLRTQSSNQESDVLFGDGPPNNEISKSEKGSSQKQERGKILMTAWCYFWGLDATIKIPLLIFIPSYVAVKLMYGAEVSKELTPLWVFGPLIVALYVKMIQGICALYVFSFKQTVRLLTSLPSYYLLVYNYVAQGKLKEYLLARFWQPIVDIRNLDYKEVSRRKLKETQEWAMEKYLDYVESIWPYYCRTIRFLKKANLI